MDLKHLDDQTLIRNTVGLARTERELLVEVLHHLREIDRRKLFSDLKYRSLFDFAVRHLGYSEDQAARRIAAMRLLCELPEIEPKIEVGELNLSHLGMASAFFKREEGGTGKPFSKEEKAEVIDQLRGTSARETEKKLASISSTPTSLIPDLIKMVSEEIVEIRFNARNCVERKIKICRGILAHKLPRASLGQLFEYLCDRIIAIDSPATSRVTVRQVDPSAEHAKALPQAQATDLPPLSWAKKKEFVHQRDGGQCTNCGSTHALQVDHIIPKAKGGPDEPSNLRLLCRNCNQRAAIQVLGDEKMGKYLNHET